MGRSLIQLYALGVCFASLMCLVVSLGLGTYDLVRIVAPGFTVQEYMLWHSDEHFLIYHPDQKNLAPQQRAAVREQYRQTSMAAERRSAQQRFLFEFIIIAIDAVVYVVHWRIAKSVAVDKPIPVITSQPAALP